MRNINIDPIASCCCGAKMRNRQARTKVAPDVIDSVKKQVRMRDKYTFNHCRTTNVLLCGASRSGKSQLFKTLADPAACPERGSGLFSDTVDTVFRTFSLTNNKEGNVYEIVVNLMDTPGTFEIKSAKEQFQERSNEEIKNLIVNCINNEVVYLNLLVLVINAMKFSEHEIESVKIFVEMFGESQLPIVLCLTHADHMNDAKRDEIEKDLKEFKGLAPYFDRNMFTVCWMGCVDTVGKDYRSVDELEQDYEDVEMWREELMTRIFESSRKSVSLLQTNIYKDRKHNCMQIITTVEQDMNWILGLDLQGVMTATDRLRISAHRDRMNFLHTHAKYILCDVEDQQAIDRFHTFYTYVERIRQLKCSDDDKRDLLGSWLSKGQQLAVMS